MLLPAPSPLPRKKKKSKLNRSALFVAKENRDSTGTNLYSKQYKDVWVALVGFYFPLLRNPLGRTVLNLNFQHLFTLFHSDSLIVSLAYLLSFFWSHLDMLSPTTAPHGITACCSYLPTWLWGLPFWTLAFVLLNPSINPVMQTLTHTAWF